MKYLNQRFKLQEVLNIEDILGIKMNTLKGKLMVMAVFLSIFLLLSGCTPNKPRMTTQTMDIKTELEPLRKFLNLPDGVENVTWGVKPLGIQGGEGIGPTDTQLYAYLKFQESVSSEKWFEPANMRVKLKQSLLTPFIPESTLQSLVFKDDKWAPKEVLTSNSFSRSPYRLTYAVWVGKNELFICAQTF